jgi:hypothetical protein
VDDPQSDHSIPRQSADQQRNSRQTSLTGEPSYKDETRIGQKNGLVRQWAKRGTRPRQPADQRYDNACLFGAICPARGVGAALALPYADTQALSASQIVALYAKRWTIEPSFRDTNDLRFGMGMNELRIGDPQRRDRLLLLNAFAVFLLTILGVNCEPAPPNAESICYSARAACSTNSSPICPNTGCARSSKNSPNCSAKTPP